MNRAGKIAIGCLLAPVGLTVIGVLAIMGLRMAGVPEPQVTTRSLEQATPFEPERIESVRREAPEPGVPAELGGAPGNHVRVVVDLEESMIEILPGPADEGFRVDAEYDEASYDLTQEYDVQKDGTPVYRVGFRSKVSFLRRLVQDGSFSDDDMGENVITVQLPLDTPMELELKLAKAEAYIDLSGLALTGVRSEFRMGEFRLESEEDNPLEMGEFATKCSMGEFKFKGLSRLRPAVIRAGGSMGELDVDLGGALTRDTEIFTKLHMGALMLNLPENAFWDPTSRAKVSWGEMTGSLSGRGADDPELAPNLRVQSNVFMGEMVVDGYRARTGLQRRGRN